MFRAVFLMVCLSVVGCDQTQTTEILIDVGDTAEAGVPLVVVPDSGDVCGPEDIIITTLPSVSAGDLLMMCTHCDVGLCEGFGNPCPSYGMPCVFDGVDSVCVGCCNGELGELHCAAP